MKGILAVIILAAITAAWYYLPPSHHQADTGIYFVRDYISFKTATGVIGWAPGQETREDLRAPFVEGSKTVTDGKFTAVIPEAVLTQDVEDAEALRVADTTEQSQAKGDLAALKTRIAKQALTAQVASAQDMVGANAIQVAASTIGMYNTALNAPPRWVGGSNYWYDGGYYNHRTVYVVRPVALSPYLVNSSVTTYNYPKSTPVPKPTPAISKALTGY